MASRVIALDGPAGSGKSTTAREVAKRLGIGHLDSGALYRAMTALAADMDPLAGTAVVSRAVGRGLRLEDRGGRFVPVVDGEDDVTKILRSPEVTARVSAVAALPEVREWVTTALREAVAGHPRGAVADGRDIGTVVFPDAAVKVFVTASLDARANRRVRDEGAASSLASIRDAMVGRDEADSRRELSPLRAAADAVTLDTTNLTFEEQVGQVVAWARESGKFA